jgi:hypothetical protein
MHPPSLPDPTSGPGGSAATGPPGKTAVDVDALADRVYRLMCREIRLDRARGAVSGMD